MKKPNKRVIPRAASFVRMAKECRKEAKLYPRSVPRAQDWRKLGKIFDGEAALLRKQR